jgi:hypothetical protein
VVNSLEANTLPGLPDSKSSKPARPASVTWLAVVVLSIAIINLFRFIQALRLWDFLAGLLPIHPAYLVLTGAFWAGTGLLLVGGLWLGKWWAPWLARLSALAYAAYYWFDRVVLSNPESRGSNTAFAASVTILLVIFIFWLFSRRKVKSFFGDPYGR